MAVLLVVGGVATVSAARFADDVLAGLPNREALKKMGRLAQATAVYDANDRPVFTISQEARIEVPLSSMSRNVVNAILAVEDQHFYSHGGIDPVRLVAAAWANFRQRRAAQGASTLTQQLARQTFLTPDKTLRRKLREMVLAERIERLFTKNEILELYLNKVYFGDGLYGIEAASRGYFAKSASELDVAQAALLAGLVQSPSSYAPTVNLQRATARRNVVLQRMRDEHVITTDQCERARREPVALRDGLQRDEAWGQYFKEQVRQELVTRFGWQRVYQGGLRVYTTIDPALQQEAERQVATALDGIEARRAASFRRNGARTAGPEQPPLEAALVALDPQTGYVRAMVGGRNFSESRFNRAMQAHRQPGSAFKPFVYAAALESGFTPATLIDHLDDPVSTPQGDWTPEDEHSDGSPMTLRTALRTSSNRAAVRLLEEVGLDRTIDCAHRLGIASVPNVPSLALGSGEVTLLSLAAAYVPFADHGIAHTPVLIRKVEDGKGDVLFKGDAGSARVLSESTAFMLTQMLADVIDAGTAAGARGLGFTLPAAGKTGTTNGFHDAWFVGFTPRLLAGVWIGFDQPKTILANGFASEVAVPLWTRFMLAATKGDKPSWYVPPPNVVGVPVCRLSGKLASDGCRHVLAPGPDGELAERSMVYTEYFVRGTEPTAQCPLHSRSFLNRLAAVFVPDTPGPVVAPQPAPTVSAQPPLPVASQETATEKEPDKKKGFWGKVVGVFRGKGSDKSDPRGIK